MKTLDLSRIDPQCVARNWQSLGWNYTFIHLEVKETRWQTVTLLALHKLDLDIAWTSVRIIVNGTIVYADFPTTGFGFASYAYSLNAVPQQAFKRAERRKVW
jgi:hypothetical protein